MRRKKTPKRVISTIESRYITRSKTNFLRWLRMLRFLPPPWRPGRTL